MQRKYLMTTISHQKEESGPQPEVGGQGRAKAYLGELLRPEVEGVACQNSTEERHVHWNLETMKLS
jgi:hypothetical protein